MKLNITFSIILVIVFACSEKQEKSDAFGNFEAEQIIVSAESGGKVLQLNVENGQKLEKGYKAAIIDTSQITLKLTQLDAQKAAVNSKKITIKSQIAVFEEQKKNLQTNKQRISNMISDGAATQKQLDDINGQITVIEKQIESTKTQIASISKEVEVINAQKLSLLDQLKKCTVLSPSNGTILETYIEEGEITTPGKPIFKMANLEELSLKVYASGAQLPNIKIGELVDVILDKNEEENQIVKGKITWISSEAEFTPKIIQTKEERVKLVYAVKILVENDGRLKIGMPGEVNWKSTR